MPQGFEKKDYYLRLKDAINSKRDEEKEIFLREFIESAKEVATDPNSENLEALVGILKEKDFIIFFNAAQKRRDDFLVDLINIAKDIARAEGSQYPNLLVEMLSRAKDGTDSLFMMACEHECVKAVNEYLNIAKEIALAPGSQYPDLLYELFSDQEFEAFNRCAEERCIDTVCLLIKTAKEIIREDHKHPNLLVDMLSAQNYLALSVCLRERNFQVLEKLILELNEQDLLSKAIMAIPDQDLENDGNENDKLQKFLERITNDDLESDEESIEQEESDEESIEEWQVSEEALQAVRNLIAILSFPSNSVEPSDVVSAVVSAYEMETKETRR